MASRNGTSRTDSVDGSTQTSVRPASRWDSNDDYDVDDVDDDDDDDVDVDVDGDIDDVKYDDDDNVQEAHAGGKALKDAGYKFDVAHTSVLQVIFYYHHDADYDVDDDDNGNDYCTTEAVC